MSFDKHDIYALLNNKSIPFTYTEHRPVYSMEELDALEIPDNAVICKNLFLRNSNGKQHFLLTVPVATPIDLKQLAATLGSSRLSFASAERLEKYLGLESGLVSPFGLLNDISKSVIFVSSKSLPPSAIIGIHPNDNTATVWLTFGDLLALLSKLQVEVRLVEV
ncbi:prolyl-tRNA synthetase associated domain-containing protein [Phascolarctobacterium succinatutens]|uniref:prolyl-tRNA synthetase associated domain-containing protein n=1 Tax=Phascolarctobacterium succinatutens TaxID=626940 RepID=UPI0026F2A21D|nr:prolyl-tRNA synthetase associated domain-containing protein [Phascolarctobacterium succinatutens]